MEEISNKLNDISPFIILLILIGFILYACILFKNKK